MQSFKKKFKELFYSFSTEDHYAEYDPNNTPNFNMGVRSGQQSQSHQHPMQGNMNPSSMHLTGDEEVNLGGDHSEGINFDDLDGPQGDQNGVSEILLAWRHIDSWTEEHNPDLNATLGDPVTNNDILHAEEDLEISFPPSVKVSLRIHDGQEDMESMTGTSGLIYGLQLMTLDQIVAMTQAWRNVALNLQRRQQQQQNSQPSSSRTSMEQQSDNDNGSNNTNTQRNQFKLPFIPQQKSIPPETIQPVYAHAAWIPMVTDNAGNHIGVDLAPGPQGIYGQVIIFGRDFDTKYVIAENWGGFLLSFANDLEEGNWWLVEDSDDYLAGDGELVFRDKKRGGPIQDYLEVLKKRVILKYKQSIDNKNTTQQPESQPQVPQNQPIHNVAPEPIKVQSPAPTVLKTDINPSKESLRLEDENDVEAIITDDEQEPEIQEAQAENVTIKESDMKDEEVTELENKETAQETEVIEGPVVEEKSTQEPIDEQIDETDNIEAATPEVINEPIETEEEPELVNEPAKESTEETEQEEEQKDEQEEEQNDEQEEDNKEESLPKDDIVDGDEPQKDDKVQEVTEQFESVAL